MLQCLVAPLMKLFHSLMCSFNTAQCKFEYFSTQTPIAINAKLLHYGKSGILVSASPDVEVFARDSISMQQHHCCKKSIDSGNNYVECEIFANFNCNFATANVESLALHSLVRFHSCKSIHFQWNRLIYGIISFESDVSIQLG